MHLVKRQVHATKYLGDAKNNFSGQSRVKGTSFKQSSLHNLQSQAEIYIDSNLSFHPASKYLGNLNVKRQDYKKFVHLLYHGLVYCVKNLKGPTEQYLVKKTVKLPQSRIKQNEAPEQQAKKFLMLDLDETLIHSVLDQTLPSDVKLPAEGTQFRFNVRPYCLQFLQNMSKHYEIYVFTAATKEYAEPIVNYLNKQNKTIQGILHRKNCLETMNGFKIKDLRIIKNRTLQDIVIVDNLVHSFGLQLDNGIPILDFTANKNDRQLVYIQKLLYQAKEYSDVRQFIRQKIDIKKCLEYNQKDFLNINSQKWVSSSKQTTHTHVQVPKLKKQTFEGFRLRNLLLCHS